MSSPRPRPIVQKTPERIDEDYIAWILKQECVVTWSDKHLPMNPHHIVSRGTGGGSRDDRLVVPLCFYHHIGCYHKNGEIKPFGPQDTNSWLVSEAFKCLLRYQDETGRMVAPLEVL